jgi:UDP-glucose 4-epimerase
MKEFGVQNIVFSSSATVYGTPQFLPVTEDHPVGQGITNPYGRTKFFIEEILKDVAKAEPVCTLSVHFTHSLDFYDIL